MPGGPRPLAHAVEGLAVADVVAVDELLVGEDVAVGVDDALRLARWCRTCSRAGPGRRRRCPRRRRRRGRRASSPSPSSRTSSSSTSEASKRGAFAASVISSFGVASVSRWRMPSSPYSTDIESRIAPSFQVPKKIAAVSGVGGRTTATRSPFSIPCSRSRWAAWFGEVLQLTPVELARSRRRSAPTPSPACRASGGRRRRRRCCSARARSTRARRRPARRTRPRSETTPGGRCANPFDPVTHSAQRRPHA